MSYSAIMLSSMPSCRHPFLTREHIASVIVVEGCMSNRRCELTSIRGTTHTKIDVEQSAFFANQKTVLPVGRHVHVAVLHLFVPCD